jgi:hypothetical protein
VPVLALVSAKGSPGVTTAAAALAAVAGPAGLRPELDPAGGRVPLLAAGPAAWGLVDAAGRLRRAAGADAIHGNAAELPPGVRVLLAPPAGHVADSVIDSGGERWLPSLRAASAEVVVDAGRWEPGQRTAGRITGADLVVLVCRPTVAGIGVARAALGRLRAAARAPVAVVVVGRKPYAPDEIAQHLDAPLGGAVAWDPRGAANLWGGGVTGRWLRSSLARSAVATRATLADLVDRSRAVAGERPPAEDTPSGALR